MRVRRPSVALALLVSAAVVAGCGSGSPSDRQESRKVPYGPPGKPLFGFHDNAIHVGTATPQEIAALAAGAGARVLRVGLDWRSSEATPGTYDFALYDRLYRALLRRGIRPLWMAAYAPPWARGPCTGACLTPPSEANEPAYAEFVQRIARRYPRAAGIEVWNEPNLAQFWQPRPDPVAYARLLRRAYTAVKDVAPHMKVVMGGLSNNAATDAQGNVAMKDYLDALYNAGVGRFTDAIAFHPYPAERTNSQLIRSVADVLEVLERYNDLRKPLWVTEVGVTTTAPDPRLRWSPTEAAQTLRDVYCRLARVPTVRMVLVHTLLMLPVAGGERGYGIVDFDRNPTPAYNALAATVRGRRPC